MKSKLLILLLTVTCFMTACNKEDKDKIESYTLGIDVQSSFKEDRVEIFVDGQELLDKELETNELLGVCLEEGQLSRLEEIGNHSIMVKVNNTVTATNQFTMSKNLYIGVNYNQTTKEISFVYSDEKFLYD